jgi:fumarate hydratase class I
VPELDALEQEVLKTANELGIGPMGFGGKTTLLGVKVGVLNRLPASFFVSVSYMCWAYRRQGVVLDANGGIQNWLY